MGLSAPSNPFCPVAWYPRKLNDDADIMEELKGLTPEQIKALIAFVKKS